MQNDFIAAMQSVILSENWSLKVRSETLNLFATVMAESRVILSADGAVSATLTAAEYASVAAPLPDRRIAAIKEMRSITGLGLKDAKALTDNLPEYRDSAHGRAESERAERERLDQLARKEAGYEADEYGRY
jgi:ribosomal protein L7/L12